MTISYNTSTVSESEHGEKSMLYSYPIVIGIHGAARSGKSTVAGMIQQRVPDARKMSLAYPIKRGVAIMLDLPISQCLHGNREAVQPDYHFSVRQALQTFGTTAGRSLNPDIWIIHLEKRIRSHLQTFPIVIVPDVRFPNEAEWVRKNGTLIFIRRPGIEGQTIGHGDHITEKGLPPLKNEIIIKNDLEGNLDHLETQVHDNLPRILTYARTKSFQYNRISVNVG